jgi:predicted enzyme related to lactoylglutathione lyase
MRLHTMIVNVGDADALERAERWYADVLGLAIDRHLAGESTFFTFGDYELGIHVGPPAQPASSITLSFVVPDVDATHAEMSARGVQFDRAPNTKPWGFRVAECADPIGHTVYLMSPSTG